MKRTAFFIIFAFLLPAIACDLPTSSESTAAALTAAAMANTPTQTSSPTVTASNTPTLTPLPTSTATVSQTPTITLTPTQTDTPTPSETVTDTPTPTFAFPLVTVNQQAHCRYGPAKAYLHAADLYAGDIGTVRGRFAYSQWLYVKFDKLDYFCWVAPSVVDVEGDISIVEFTEPWLPGPSTLYNPPSNVTATRDGDQVTISWKRVVMTGDDDRGYLITAWVCQDGHYLWWTISFADQYTTSYTVTDQEGCSLPSSGKLYTVEKHGYSSAVSIPWP